MAQKKTYPIGNTCRIARVRTHATIAWPEIEALVERAAEACGYLIPGYIYRELVERVGEDGLGIFVGFEGKPAEVANPDKTRMSGFATKPKALVVAILPASPLMMAPQMPLCYSDGSAMLIRHVGRRMKEWIMAAGYDRMLSVSLNHSAAAWERGFREIGEMTVLGELIECRF